MSLKDRGIYESIANIIVQEQKEVIGPVALRQAQDIEGIKVAHGKVTIISDDPKTAIDNLVKAYSELFGRASVELSKEAILELHVEKDKLPQVLQ
jgi:hypothetical protein